MINSQATATNDQEDKLSPKISLESILQSKIDSEVDLAKKTAPPAKGSVIGSDLAILGQNIKIVSKETLQIDGEIHGDVSGKNVNIGRDGLVIGAVCATVVKIDGGVQGTVRAKEVLLNADAKVSGDLVQQSLIIKEGAEFDGRVRRPKDAAELEPNLDISSSPLSSETVKPAPLAAPALPTEH